MVVGSLPVMLVVMKRVWRLAATKLEIDGKDATYHCDERSQSRRQLATRTVPRSTKAIIKAPAFASTCAAVPASNVACVMGSANQLSPLHAASPAVHPSSHNTSS